MHLKMLSPHYNDVIMGTIASQITSLTIVYSIVYSNADQRKHQSSASLAFVRGITQSFIQTQIKENIKGPRHWPLCGEFTGDRWIPRTNGQLRGKCFHLMTSSWKYRPLSSDFNVLTHWSLFTPYGHIKLGQLYNGSGNGLLPDWRHQHITWSNAD